MHTRNVEKSKAHRATDTQAQQHGSGWIMTHHTKKSKNPRVFYCKMQEVEKKREKDKTERLGEEKKIQFET
jgi:hypothetical protein